MGNLKEAGVNCDRAPEKGLLKNELSGFMPRS